MKRLHSFGTIVCSIATFCLITACSQDELQGDMLSDELRPLVLQTNFQPVTRSTIHNQWVGGEQVKIRLTEVDILQGDIYDYTYTADASGNLTCNAPYYWPKIQEWELVVCAYYPTDLDNELEKRLPTDQSTEQDFQSTDALFAPPKSFFYQENGQYKLDFYHQNVKLVVNVLNTGLVAGYQSTDVSLSVGPIRSEGIYRSPVPILPGESPYGNWESLAGSETFTPYRLLKPNVVNGTSTVASFELVVLPQTVEAGNTLFTFTVGGQNYCYTVPTGGVTWNIGNKYIFNVTIGHELKVEMEEAIGWDPDGASGDGSVVLP